MGTRPDEPNPVSGPYAISSRVPIAGLEQAKWIAEKTGVGCQTVLKLGLNSPD